MAALANERRIASPLTFPSTVRAIYNTIPPANRAAMKYLSLAWLSMLQALALHHLDVSQWNYAVLALSLLAYHLALRFSF